MSPWYIGGIFALLATVECNTDIINKLLLEHEERTARKINETTLDAAWKIVKKKNITIVNALDVQGQSARGRKLRHGFQALQSDETPAGSAAVAGAIKMINDMIAEADEKYDNELESCCKFDFSQTGMMNETRVAISMANKRAAEASEKILSARAGIESCNKQLPISTRDFHQWNEQCTGQISKLDHLIETLKHDVEVIGDIILTSGCQESGATAASMLLVYRCEDKCGEYVTVDMPGKEMTPRMRELALQMFSKAKQDPLANANMTTTSAAPRTSSVNTPCKAKRTLDPMASSCKLEPGGKSCAPILEKFTGVQTGLVETLQEKQLKRADTGANCERVAGDFMTEISGLKTSLGDFLTQLASSTAIKNSADEVSRTKGVQLVEMMRSYSEMTKECHANYDELENEICALTKIRMSVMMKLKSTNSPSFFQDCKVSKWVEVEPGCSVSCGGGVVKRQRTIEVYPMGGTKCPHLEAVASCNTDKCPIDCKVGDWSGWGACSARECGGGVQDRTRPINVEPMYGGEQCGETEEVRNCNVQACDAPCTLSDWTAWTNCSKACNQGHTQRIRTILEPSVGEGECWKMEDPKRLQREMCNRGPCPAQEGQLLQCQSKKDVVVMIDGSGSVGEEGWELEMRAAQMLRTAMNPKPEGSNMAAVVFSGPKYLCDYYYCVGATDTDYFNKHCASKDPDAMNCGITRVSNFTQVTSDLKVQLQAASWPALATMLGKALGEVESLLDMGEKDAEAVVIVLIDGYPADMKATARAAKSLNNKAKVIWVPITHYASLGPFREWAGDPENVIPVEDFLNLDAKVVGDITATACRNVVPIELKPTTTPLVR